VENTLNTIKTRRKIRIAFFVKQGLDTFIDEIINDLSNQFDTKRIIVTEYKQIDVGMEWADICWFEWCDELIIYGSAHRISGAKKIICRLHSYEAFTFYPMQVHWENVDCTIFVSEHIRTTLLKETSMDIKKTIIIPNGVNITKYSYCERKNGFNIAYLGYINYKKGPQLLIQTIKSIVNRDSRYKLYIAGEFQDIRYIQYFKQMIDEMNLNKNVFYLGWQGDINNWLEDKQYILCTSLLESQGMGVMQAMAKGIKPVIHNFVGAKEVYDRKYLWNTVDEAVEMVLSNEYNSLEYRKFIEDKYEASDKIDKISNLIMDIYGVDKYE
jgi:glycosyltransferase involved in cell wall biosynthesis